jgi:hypothetical protein
MTRVCSRCHQFLGQKCPECNTPAEFARVNADNRVLAQCPNPKCVITDFPIGESGVTHGVCPSCSVALGYLQVDPPPDIDSFVEQFVVAGYQLRELLRIVGARFAKLGLRAAGGHHINAARRMGLHRNTLARYLNTPDRDPLPVRRTVRKVRAHDLEKADGGAA